MSFRIVPSYKSHTALTSQKTPFLNEFEPQILVRIHSRGRWQRIYVWIRLEIIQNMDRNTVSFQQSHAIIELY
jgi:hypothetical protein